MENEICVFGMYAERLISRYNNSNIFFAISLSDCPVPCRARFMHVDLIP